jgi:hypothetical protein
MADLSTLTPEQRQAILMHLQGGGDPAHAAAVADGAITPALAQQMAQAAPDSSASLLNPEQMRALAAAGQPTDGSVPVSPQEVAAAQAAMDAPAAAAPVVAVDSNLPPNPRGKATSLIDSLGTAGQDTLKKSAEFSGAIPEAAKRTAEAGVVAAQAKAAYQVPLDEATHDVLERSNTELSDLDRRESEALQLRQDTMDKVLRQMLDSANDVAQAAPHDFWADKSTSSRIFGILSQIAGGMANGLANQPGQPTPLDRVIQRDLDQQRLEFAQKSQTGNQASGIYNDLVKATGSTTEAYGALRVAAYKRVLGQIEELKTQNPALKESAELAATEASINQKLTDTLSATAKQLGETGINAQKNALTNATSIANNDADNATQLKVADKNAAAKLGAAKAANDDTYERDGIVVVPNKQPIPIPKSNAAIIDKTRAAYDVINDQVNHVEAILHDDGAMPTDVKAALLAQAKATIVREIGAGYNAGNRPADIYNAMVAGGVPKNLAQTALSFFTADEMAPEATIASMRATAAAIKSNVNAQLRYFNRQLAE